MPVDELVSLVRRCRGKWRDEDGRRARTIKGWSRFGIRSRKEPIARRSDLSTCLYMADVRGPGLSTPIPCADRLMCLRWSAETRQALVRSQPAAATRARRRSELPRCSGSDSLLWWATCLGRDGSATSDLSEGCKQWRGFGILHAHLRVPGIISWTLVFRRLLRTQPMPRPRALHPQDGTTRFRAPWRDLGGGMRHCRQRDAGRSRLPLCSQ